MTQLPNIVLIMTDQQRADTVRALGATWMITPNLDRLVAEGTAFTNCFVTSPVCVGSRASLFTGMYPHAAGVFHNFQPWQPSWVRWLASAGYHCVNIGKMHINPYDALGGFHQRFVVENKDRPLFLDEHDRAIYDEWDKALKSRGLVKPTRYNRFERDPEGYRRALGAFVWDLPEEMHPDNFVADNALWWIDERKAKSPLFLQIGFPGPHPPYDPAARFIAMYANSDIPVPDVTAEEIRRQPGAQRALRRNMIEHNFDSVAWREGASREDLLRLRRHYCANVTMIDRKLGEIMDALERRGCLENTIVVFTSDHADALGDHGHIQKWTMYDCVERVPLIIRAPGRVAAGRVIEDPVQLIDIAPTLLEAAAVPVPANWESRSLRGAIEEGAPGAEWQPRDAVYSELARDHIQSGAEFIVMRRDREWKLVYYLGEPEGELYDLAADPDELRNLWEEPHYREKKDELTRAVLEWSMRASLRSRLLPSRNPQPPMFLR